MAGSYGSLFYALWVQRTNENPTAARQLFAVKFSDKHYKKIRARFRADTLEDHSPV